MATYIFDVRTRHEWLLSHEPKATLAPEILDGVVPDVPKDSDIYVYCRSGGRAEVARRILHQHGFENVTNLGGVAQAKEFAAKNL